MKKPLAIRTTTLAVALIAGLLASCGGDNPDSLIASGKDFLAKNDSKAAIIQFKNALQQNPDPGRQCARSRARPRPPHRTHG